MENQLLPALAPLLIRATYKLEGFVRNRVTMRNYMYTKRVLCTPKVHCTKIMSIYTNVHTCTYINLIKVHAPQLDPYLN